MNKFTWAGLLSYLQILKVCILSFPLLVNRMEIKIEVVLSWAEAKLFCQLEESPTNNYFILGVKKQLTSAGCSAAHRLVTVISH